MARLPDTIERRIPESPRGVVPIRPIAYAGMGAVADSLDTASRIAFHVQEERRQAQSEFDSNNAETELLKSHMTLTDSLSGDNYSDYVPSYQKGMEQAKNDALKLIRDPAAQQRFAQRADLMIVRGTDQAHNLALKKEGDLGIATTIRNTDTLTEKGRKATDEATRIQSLDLIRGSWEAAYKNGWIDRTQADAAQKKAATNYMTGVFEDMPPAARIAALTGKKGLAAQLPSDLAANLLERAQSELVAQQNAAKKAHDDAVEKGIVEAGQSIMQDPTRGLSAVDHNLLSQLNPTQILNLRHFADEMSKGNEVKTDPTYLDEQMTLAATDPQAFLDGWDMSANIAHLNSADVEKLINVKAGVIKDDPATKLHLSSTLTASSIIDDTMNTMQGMGKKDTNPEQEVRKNLFKQKASQAVYNLQTQLGRANLSPDEIHSVIDPLAIESAHHWFSPNTYSFESSTPATESIAATKPAEAKAQPPATKPAAGMTIDQVPADIRRRIQDSRTRHGLDTSDESIVADYQTYLQKQAK